MAAAKWWIERTRRPSVGQRLTLWGDVRASIKFGGPILKEGIRLWKNAKRQVRPAGTMRAIIGLFDVLGFESQFATSGLHKMARKYRSLIAATKRAADQPDTIKTLMPAEIPIVPEPGEGAAGVWIGPTEINHAYFSDTILLWSPYHPYSVHPFFDACVSMVQESLEVGLPLRGSISIGDVIFDSARGIFLGGALIEAARLEKDQRWIGVTLSATFLKSPFDTVYPCHTIPYAAHFKDPEDRKKLALVLDWPRAYREQKITNFANKVLALDVDPRFSQYYTNTLAFIKYSRRYAQWGKDHKKFLSKYPYVE
jgi:hypothetical protein